MTDFYRCVISVRNIKTSKTSIDWNRQDDILPIFGMYPERPK